MPQTILIVEDDKIVRTILERWLTAEAWRVVACDSASTCLDRLAQVLPDAVCLDLNLPDGEGLSLLAQIQRIHPETPVLVLTADASAETAARALQAGAFDYLTKPLDRVRLLTSLRNALRSQALSQLVHQHQQATTDFAVPGLLGISTAMRKVRELIHLVAARRVDVLIEGETGTGKEAVARGIHALGQRPNAPFVAINCATLSETLMDSELFGHERNAFTGAHRQHAGRFEQADGGTLFLDEVGELSLTAQAKLLRVLQERRFYRVGGTAEIGTDFRLIAATNRSLPQMVQDHRFREDLLFRIAVFEIHVPPLREHLDDIGILAAAFLAQQAKLPEGQKLTLSPAAVRTLTARPWPGNVRELQNALRRGAVVAGPDGVLVIGGAPPPMPGTAATPQLRTLAEVEREAIELAVERHGADLLGASRALGIGRSTLYRKLAAYGLPLPKPR